MAKNIMIQGTMSSAGKSYIVTGLCRYYARKGYKVAPFKSQNMALNSFATEDGLEMGRAQVVQAEAAGVKPSVYMNPVLLKPTTDVGSQVIVNGVSIGNMRAKEYYEYKKSLIPTVIESYNKLASENDIIIIEGAGSPAEINLKENDIVNMGLAKMLNAPVLLVGDIDPGGVFAQIYGTISLLDEDERDRIKGIVINKFRGDVKLLQPGLQMLEEKCKKPVVGVVPMSIAKIDEEDSITSAFENGIAKNSLIDIAIIKLPRISNFTDFNALSSLKDVSVRYVDSPSKMGSPDMVIIPGTKSTLSDLEWLKATGLADMIKGLSKEILICGICGGMQMLGKRIEDEQNIEGGGSAEGLGLLPIESIFKSEKTLKQISGLFSELDGEYHFLNGVPYKGYEIHNGISEDENRTENVTFTEGNVIGTYIHGIFDTKEVVEAFVLDLGRRKGINNLEIDTVDMNKLKMKQYDIIADELEKAIDFDALNRIIGI